MCCAQRPLNSGIEVSRAVVENTLISFFFFFYFLSNTFDKIIIRKKRIRRWRRFLSGQPRRWETGLGCAPAAAAAAARQSRVARLGGRNTHFSRTSSEHGQPPTVAAAVAAVSRRRRIRHHPPRGSVVVRPSSRERRRRRRRRCCCFAYSRRPTDDVSGRPSSPVPRVRPPPRRRYPGVPYLPTFPRLVSPGRWRSTVVKIVENFSFFFFSFFLQFFSPEPFHGRGPDTFPPRANRCPGGKTHRRGDDSLTLDVSRAAANSDGQEIRVRQAARARRPERRTGRRGQNGRGRGRTTTARDDGRRAGVRRGRQTRRWRDRSTRRDGRRQSCVSAGILRVQDW